MSSESQNILASFDALSVADQLFVAAQIARRVPSEKAADEGDGAAELESTSELTPQEIEAKLKQFSKWASSRKPRNPNVDDSRESIYEGCGE